jgi:hypothetical protein
MSIHDFIKQHKLWDSRKSLLDRHWAEIWAEQISEVFDKMVEEILLDAFEKIAEQKRHERNWVDTYGIQGRLPVADVVLSMPRVQHSPVRLQLMKARGSARTT